MKKNTLYSTLFLLLSLSASSCVKTKGMSQTQIDANRISQHQSPALWQVATQARSTDLVEFIDESRVLVGEVMEKGKTFGPLKMLNANTGQLLWSAQRPESPDSTYALLETSPNLLILRSGPTNAEIFALNPLSGQQEGKLEFKGEIQFEKTPNKILIVASGDAQQFLISAISLQNGNTLWNTATTVKPSQILVSGNDVLLSYPHGAMKLALDTGEQSWQIDLKNMPLPNIMPVNMTGTIIWDANNVVLFDTATGKRSWQYKTKNVGIKTAVHTENRILLVQKGIRLLDSDTIIALDAKRGKELWKTDTLGLISSPIAIIDNIIAFTIEDALIAYQSIDGSKVYHSSFTQEFSRANPTFIEQGGILDSIARHGNNIIVDRATQGLISFNAKTGIQSWQSNLHPGTQAYHIPSLLQDLQSAFQPTDAPSPPAPPIVDLTISSPNWFSQQAQNRHHSANETQSEGRLISSTAHAAMAIERMSLVLQPPNIYDEVATQTRLTLMGAVRARNNSFMGKYHFQAFVDDDGRGMRITNLDTGTTNDIVAAPKDLLDTHLLADTQLFGISPGGNRIVTIAIGIDPNAYVLESRVVNDEKVTGPSSSSIICFNPMAPKRDEVPPTSQDASNQPNATAGGSSSSPVQNAFSVLGKGHLFEVRKLMRNERDRNFVLKSASVAVLITNRHNKLALALLDEGANINAATPLGATPLHAATHRQNLPMMKQLLERGAKVDAKNNYGWTPLMVALHPQSPYSETMYHQVKLLLNNGANPNQTFNISADIPQKTLLEVAQDHGHELPALFQTATK